MRRAVDVVVGVLAALLLSPVLLAVAIAIRCADGPPVLFRQERWGRGGQVFVIWKFRTMRPQAHPGQPDCERSLPLGRLLRASSLDELPQLWNIIRGDMSLIGPRPWPVMPGDELLYTPRQWGRLAVRPGLTGWAQVNGRNALPFPERIEQDLWYIAHRSLLLDLRILALTLGRLVRPSGIVGYGVANPGFSVGLLGAPVVGLPPAPPPDGGLASAGNGLRAGDPAGGRGARPGGPLAAGAADHERRGADR
ncbi:sugar transferase [Geodermatophilus sp. CPCC 206100]|uniref:sugar transferase n=1 Tax=Geodermatophilus sp. CPCC 206100 TaxID=3020054 RepID=UPI003B00092F